MSRRALRGGGVVQHVHLCIGPPHRHPPITEFLFYANVLLNEGQLGEVRRDIWFGEKEGYLIDIYIFIYLFISYFIFHTRHIDTQRHTFCSTSV